MDDDVYYYIIAKTENHPILWLPLWMHHRDTEGVMSYLLDSFVSPSIAVSCGMDMISLRKTASFLAMVHDIGKATVGFQYKIGKSTSERVSILEKYGIKLPDSMDMSLVRKTPHALAGEAILRYLGCPESIAVVVGAHHGEPTIEGIFKDVDLSCTKKNGIVGKRNFFGDEEQNRSVLESSWREILNKALKLAELNSVNELSDISVKAQMILSGLLITADWIASNTEYFPLISIDEIGDESVYQTRIDAALEELCFSEMWESQKNDYNSSEFRHTFGFSPNKIQQKIIDIIKNTNDPGLFIFEAPMGCGKTEAALSSAELLAAKCEKNGIFFGMPTQATANGIFPRIINWAEKHSEEYYHSIQLKHGSAEFNEVFKKIQRGIPDEESDSGLIVHSWFCNNKRACLANFVVATVDQMLMMALKRRHVMLLHLGLSEKVVIIDEVHAYDAYMNQYLERALQWLGAYHTPVILLSATLPAKKRMSLVRAYLGQKRSDESFEKNISYPLLTYTDGDRIKQESLPYEGEHKNVKIAKCTNNDMLDIIHSAVKNGSCVGVILNTVSRAQNTAEAVRNEITDNVLLYHAQFIMPDRAKKEKELLTKIGKDSKPDTRAGFVVIGTQVLEQSLDIDFDLLITDICPIDLLLQRIGRLHRHSGRIRPKEFKMPECYVVTDEYDNPSTGSKIIYGEWLLKKTIELLPENVLLPDDISPLVQQVYNAFDESETYQKYVYEINSSENRAEAFLVDEPDNSIDDTIHGLLDKTIEDNHAESSVRDGISSLEILLMKLYDDGSIGFIGGEKLSNELSENECERIAQQKLRLPSKFSQRWNIIQNISEIKNKSKELIQTWQNSYFLKDHLVVFLNENNETELCGYTLSYDQDIGLVCK